MRLDYYKKSLTTLLSVDTQIVQESSVCLRIQTWILTTEFPSKAVAHARICAHIRLQDPYILNVLRAACNTNIDSRSGRRPRLHTYRCMACGLDYQLDAISFGAEGIALVITKWLDLGPGVVPTDVRWTRHLPGTTCFQSYEMITSDSYVRSQFEKGTLFTSDNLTRQNASFLDGRAYTRKMDWWYSGCWILQANR